MSERLFISCFKELDDDSKNEEAQIEQIEKLIEAAFPQLVRSDSERLVLDILMAHHHGKDPREVARTQRITSTESSSKTVDVVPTKQVTLSNDLTSFTPESPFDQLRRVLGPENSDDDIERALAHNDFDFSRTVEMLAGETRELQMSKEKMASRIMCKYFMQGYCVRGPHCMYSHDGSDRICRFWLHQRCSSGENCLFVHGVPRLPASLQIQEPKKTSIGLGSLKALPALGAKKSKASTSVPTQVRTSTAPVNFAGSDSPSKSFSSVQNGTVSTNSFPTLAPIKEMMPKMNTGLVPLVKPGQIPWVNTGFGINQEYLELRQQALNAAEQRNKILQQSTAAWSQNNSERAKQLSDRGRTQEQRMIQANREAAELLWNQRNTPGSEVWLDLHGLDLTDAIDYLGAKLTEFSQQQKHAPRCVYVLTGRGHFFTKKHADQMSQYVQAFLDTKGYKHKDYGVDTRFGRITAVDPWSSLVS